MTQNRLQRVYTTIGCLVLAGMVVVGCQKKPAGPGAGPAMQGLARANGDGDHGAGGAEQRVCGHHQVAALGHAAAAGERAADRRFRSTPATT